MLFMSHVMDRALNHWTSLWGRWNSLTKLRHSVLKRIGWFQHTWSKSCRKIILSYLTYTILSSSQVKQSYLVIFGSTRNFSKLWGFFIVWKKYKGRWKILELDLKNLSSNSAWHYSSARLQCRAEFEHEFARLVKLVSFS